MCWRTAFPANVVLLCALVLCMGASSATAQEADSQPEPRTRQEMLQRERAAKVERAASYAPGFLERWLVKVEKDPTPEDLFRASDGFYLQAGGITTGGMSRALLKLSGSLVHDYATISDDSPSPNRASRARRAATSAGIS